MFRRVDENQFAQFSSSNDDVNGANSRDRRTASKRCETPFFLLTINPFEIVVVVVVAK